MNPAAAGLLEQSVWAAVAAATFAVIFNVPPRGLGACATVAALGFCLRGILVGKQLCSLELATLVAATVISLLSTLAGRILRDPPLLYAIPGVIPFVPGALALRCTNEAIELVTQVHGEPNALLVATLTDGLKVILIIAAMASGVAIPSLLFRRDRPLL
jgi:uncharacterized membrane protein YjjB (DUF3815 family)